MTAFDGLQAVDYAAVFREKHGRIRIEMKEADTGEWHFLVFCDSGWFFQGPQLVDVINAAAGFEVPLVVPREPARSKSIKVKENKKAGVWEVRKNRTAIYYAASAKAAFKGALIEVRRMDEAREAWLDEWHDVVTGGGYGTVWVWAADCWMFNVDGENLVREFPLRGADWGRS